jgi:hypothetical protein
MLRILALTTDSIRVRGVYSKGCVTESRQASYTLSLHSGLTALELWIIGTDVKSEIFWDSQLVPVILLWLSVTPEPTYQFSS